MSDPWITWKEYYGRDIATAPVIENIHQKVYEAASRPGALNMGLWHSRCGTSHCRAGWVIELAGEAGYELENKYGPADAARIIYLASDPTIESFPSFSTTDERALADMKHMAELEAVRATR